MIKELDRAEISRLGFLDHERVVSFGDERVGLRGFVAIHNTNLGPATGGTRFKIYDRDEDALYDALNLSRAMTYKCAMSGVPFGGGKAVIINNGRKDREFFESYARIINSFNGSFTTGKDVGIGDEEIGHMSKISKFINGHSGDEDPSLYAALGVFIGIKSALKSLYGSASLENRKVAIKGLGQVGFELARLIKRAGGRLVLADIDEGRVRLAKNKFSGAKFVAPAEIHKTKCDVYAPCALGGEFTNQTISEIQCRVICGAANNQLASSEVDEKIVGRRIIYVPDYIANAGGLIAVVDGLRFKKFRDERVRKNLLVIRDNVTKIIELSKKDKRPPQEIANDMAEKRFMKAV